MNFIKTPLKNAFIIEPERLEDERGFFARTYCRREFAAHDLNPDFVQCNISFNLRKGTLRGMHHQVAPHEEAKLVRCTMGAIYDVIIDLRPDSETYKKWFGVELKAADRRMLYIPEGLTNGFITLADNTEVFYQMSEFYTPDSAKGVRWNDPLFGIVWPGEVKHMSERDKNFPDFVE